jgi:hypothetical protein
VKGGSLVSTLVVRVEATIELTTHSAATITPREISRHIEDCNRSRFSHSATSCSLPPPLLCTIRRPDQDRERSQDPHDVLLDGGLPPATVAGNEARF